MRKGRPHRAWAMLAGCCVLQGASLGLVHNCRGVFYAPVISELGFGMGAFSFYILFFGLFSCLILPVVGRLFARVDSRLLLGGASLFFAGSVISMGFFRTLPAFYIAGAVQGLAGAFLLFFPAPLILGNWFRKKRGLAVGISSAFAGAAGMAGNPLINAVIGRFGWRIAYWSVGGAVLLLLLPVSVFLLRLRPEDVGLLPYGAEESAATAAGADGVTAAEARRIPAFWLLVLASLLAANLCGLHNHLSPLGITAGYGSAAGAWLMSASMGGNIAGKLALGHVYDRFGLEKTLLGGSAAVMAGLILLLVDSFPLRLLGALLYGVCMALSSVVPAVAVSSVYGARGYHELLSYVSMSATLGTALTTVAVGYAVDALGGVRGYAVSLAAALAVCAGMGVLFLVSARRGRRAVARLSQAQQG